MSRNALSSYKKEHNLTTYEVLCKAKADYIGKPLRTDQYSPLVQEAVSIDRHMQIPLPHYLLRFLENERRRKQQEYARDGTQGVLWFGN